ncbi:hypothetical protein [uncultured Novosphingobium sp.]|uniref:DUF7662 domain-containing protein n=1 Tax=uncultured Novosphingobium sp. TaxID=292277 RepID=UPI0025962333|nr:hypothetical protein [uncultured Novosphingobium sp.]
MKKYAPLTSYLQSQTADRITLSFKEITEILGAALPGSAVKHGVWWTNSPSSGRHNEAWLTAGWKTSNRNLKAQTIQFERIGISSQPKQQVRQAAPRSSFDPSMLTETDFAADCTVTLQLRWQRLGAVALVNHKLVFPEAPKQAGLYRLTVRLGNRTTVYVGEAVNLKRRFGNYRRPGNTQQTSLRLNALLIEAIGQGGAISVDIAYDNIGLSVGGKIVAADLADKAVRRMIEQAAIVAHGGVDVEMLNR